MCVGRGASKRCPHFVPGVEDHILEAKAAADEQDSEVLSVLLPEDGMNPVALGSDGTW